MIDSEQPLKMWYLDTDGDIISITTDSDYQEAKLANPARLIIADSLEQVKDTITTTSMQRSEL